MDNWEAASTFFTSDILEVCARFLNLELKFHWADAEADGNSELAFLLSRIGCLIDVSASLNAAKFTGRAGSLCYVFRKDSKEEQTSAVISINSLALLCNTVSFLQMI